MSVSAVRSLSSSQEAYTGIDLDASANTAPTPAVVSAVLEAMSHRHGNPSSGHWRGELARGILANARDAVASLVEGALEDGVIFTSGCTESNNLVLDSFARAGARIVTCAVEHPSVLTTVRRIAGDGGNVTILPVDGAGILNLRQLEEAVHAGTGPVLISVQVANSETGVVQDIAAIARMVSSNAQVVFHSDAAQAYGKIDIAMGRGLGPDIVTISGHKLHAPMGVGAVIFAEDADVELAPMLTGGEQERGIRAGTQPVPAIAGLGVACAEWRAESGARRMHLAGLRELLETSLLRLGRVTINGMGALRLPNVSSVTFHDCDAIALVGNLDARGIAASQGSACSSRRPEASHVLRAMGLSEQDAFSTVRFSLSVLNNAEEVEHAAEVVADVVSQLRARA